MQAHLVTHAHFRGARRMERAARSTRRAADTVNNAPQGAHTENGVHAELRASYSNPPPDNRVSGKNSAHDGHTC
eukprot:CAMPEP_0174308158 /NCGR_PEP_ID=MMETSP0810-20121108/1571_1 /TAXON_ID=73025 ORGANISM="Eutreptiella gymnastica-like, Strain CCMP1594" /NCGR_SAMPLE_ID=MMETSP0810 /ASSEMBLY_ACC=CAM_ASM_000659 /LENGTH=73 /DNA_ID=CAMNT_0015415393 /DNA_START=1127 /DNA_END=1348 /DNA_ORIENTATION=+